MTALRLLISVIALTCLGLTTAAASAKKALVVYGETRFKAQATDLAGSLVMKGFTVSLAIFHSKSELRDKVLSYEAKLQDSDTVLLYLLGSSFHRDRASYLNFDGGGVGLDDFFQTLEPLYQNLKVSTRYLVLDLCRAGPKPTPAFQPGLGPFLGPPPGVVVLVPGTPGQLLLPDEDLGRIVSQAFLGEVTLQTSSLFPVFQRAAQRLTALSSGRLESWVAASLMADHSGPQPALMGTPLHQSLKETLAQWNLPEDFAGPVARNQGDDLSWVPSEKPGTPGRLTVRWSGWFPPKEMTQARQNGFTKINLFFGKNGVGGIQMTTVLVGSYSPDVLPPLLRTESFLRSFQTAFPTWPLHETDTPHLSDSNKTAETALGSYLENNRKVQVGYRFQGPGESLSVRTVAQSAAVESRGDLDHYAEITFTVTLQDDTMTPP